MSRSAARAPFLKVGEPPGRRRPAGAGGTERSQQAPRGCDFRPTTATTAGRGDGASGFRAAPPDPRLSEEGFREDDSPSPSSAAYSSRGRGSSESYGAPLATALTHAGTRRRGGGRDAAQEKFESMLQDGRFDEALALLARSPGLARQEAGMVWQGERSRAHPLHLAVADSSPSMELVQALVTSYPAALTKGDTALGRTPLQVALWKCPRSSGVIRYLVSARSQALEVPDGQGNLPLHAAIFYSQPDEVVELLLERYPPACRHENERGKLPIHVYCSRGWVRDRESSSSSPTSTATSVLDKLVRAYPESLERPDKEGRLPLHAACSSPHPSWELLSALMDAHPAALLSQTNSHKTPLQLLRQATAHGSGSCQEDNNVVLAMVRDRTARERRRLGARRGAGGVVGKLLFRKRSGAADEGGAGAGASSPIDLYNCYG